MGIDVELCFVVYYYFWEAVGLLNQIGPQTVVVLGGFLGGLQVRNREVFEGYCAMWGKFKNVEQTAMIDIMARVLNVIFGQ